MSDGQYWGTLPFQNSHYVLECSTREVFAWTMNLDSLKHLDLGLGIFSVFLLTHSSPGTVAGALTGSRRCMFISCAFLKLFPTFLSPVWWHRWEFDHTDLPHPMVLQEQLCLSSRTCTGVLSPAGQRERTTARPFLVSSFSVLLLPSGWAVCSPGECSSLQWLPDIKHSQAALWVCGHPPIRGASAALPPWLGKAQITSQMEKKLPGGFPTTAILAKFSSAQSEWKELQMPQLS